MTKNFKWSVENFNSTLLYYLQHSELWWSLWIGVTQLMKEFKTLSLYYSELILSFLSNIIKLLSVYTLNGCMNFVLKSSIFFWIFFFCFFFNTHIFLFQCMLHISLYCFCSRVVEASKSAYLLFCINGVGEMGQGVEINIDINDQFLFYWKINCRFCFIIFFSFV